MKTIKILQLSSHNESCGIGRYQEQFVDHMKSMSDVETNFFSISPYALRPMNSEEFKKALFQLEKELNSYDILHIQHEYSFFKDSQLAAHIAVARRLKKKVIITFHTAPDAHYPQPTLAALRVKSTLRFMYSKVRARAFRQSYIEPLNKADMVLTPNNLTKNNLIKYGVIADKIQLFTHPVPEVKSSKKSTEIHKALSVKPGDTIISTVGYISETKGVLDAVKALLFLPATYKLAIIGGVHPRGNGEAYLNHIADVISQNRLQDRVHITGFIEDDARRHALVRESDICLYPYEKAYYQFVSSAALNDAFANAKPIVAYPTEAFKETDGGTNVLNLTTTFSYHELAQKIVSLDLKKAAKQSKEFATTNSYSNKTNELVGYYRQLL